MIDEANAQDPQQVDLGGTTRPAALVYGERMSETLGQVTPNATEHLQIAARGQHIERWKLARSDFDEGRTGYLKWRKQLQTFHADRLGELMNSSGYGTADCERVSCLVRKVALKSDAEVQALEDVACLVFLEHYAGDLFARYDDGKVVDILKKTARKMSTQGLAAAARLDLGARHAKLLGEALADEGLC